MSRVSTPIFPDRKRGPQEAIHPWGHSRVIPRKVPCPLSPSGAALSPATHIFSTSEELQEAGRCHGPSPLQMSPESHPKSPCEIRGLEQHPGLGVLGQRSILPPRWVLTEQCKLWFSVYNISFPPQTRKQRHREVK